MRILLDKAFLRDVARWKKAGWNMDPLEQFMRDADDVWPLSAKYQVHPLKGPLKGMWDAHIRQNWVVLFRKGEGSVTLLRTGTHASVGI